MTATKRNRNQDREYKPTWEPNLNLFGNEQYCVSCGKQVNPQFVAIDNNGEAQHMCSEQQAWQKEMQLVDTLYSGLHSAA